MTKETLSKVAAKLLDESLGVKKGETLTVETWNNGLGFALEVVRQARRRGAIPILLLEDERNYLDGVRNTPKDVLGKMGKHEYGLLSATDAYVFIPGPALGVYYKRLSRQEYADSTSYNSSWYKAAKKAGLRGARLYFGYVGTDLSRLLGKTVKQVVDGQLEATFADFGKVSRSGRELAARMKDGSRVTVLSDTSKLDFRLKGELEVEDGVVDESDMKEGQNMHYLPPGYALKEVAPGTARGEVQATGSLTKLGVVADAQLKFQKGRIVKWSSKKSGEALNGLLEGVKPANRKLVYFSIGLNPRLRYGYGLDRFVRGAACISGWGFTAVCRNATVTIGKETVVERGKLTV